MTYTISADDIVAFTQGDCWALAKEINRRTRWTAYALGAYKRDGASGKYDYPLADFDWVHVINQTPDGRYLDVTGFVTEGYLTETYLRHVEAYFGWRATELVYEPVIGDTDWAALTGKPVREYPQAPVAKVAANLIRTYHASRSVKTLDR